MRKGYKTELSMLFVNVARSLAKATDDKINQVLSGGYSKLSTTEDRVVKVQKNAAENAKVAESTFNSLNNDDTDSDEGNMRPN